MADFSVAPLITLGSNAAAAAFLAFVATGGVFLAAALRLLFVARRRARLARVDDPLDLELEAAASEGVFGGLTPALAAQIPESKKERGDFQKLLRSAGLYSPSAATSIYALRFVLLAVPVLIAAITALLADSEYTFPILIAGGIAAAICSIIPRLYVFFRRRSRVEQIRRGLPDVLDMLSMCVDGGLSMGDSLEQVADRLNGFPALRAELKIVKRQADVGSLQQALADFSARIDAPEVRQLANLLTRSDQLGTQMTGSLHSQADQIRTARKQRATMQANKTPVKLVLPVLFCFAPAAIILMTAPAVLELKEFLAPSNGSAVLGTDSFGTQSIVDTLDELDQTTNLP